jgi:hypothetical protein
MLVLLKKWVYDTAVEMGCGSMIYKQSFVQIGTGEQAILVIVIVIVMVVT